MTSRFLLTALAALCISCALPPVFAQDLPATPRAEIRFDAATERAFDRTGRHVSIEQRADGSVLTELNGSFQNVTVARIGPGGVIETYCTTSQEDATRWMAREGETPPQARNVDLPPERQP